MTDYCSSGTPKSWKIGHVYHYMADRAELEGRGTLFKASENLLAP
jgi:hypothetical protein